METNNKKTSKLKKIEKTITFYCPENEEIDFIPWFFGETGSQKFIKLLKDEKEAYLLSSLGGNIESQTGKNLMRLKNQGWSEQGEVEIYFSGETEKEFDLHFKRNTLTIELGLKLLPLVDPTNGAPILEEINKIRLELSKQTGLIIPGIKICDNKDIGPNQYLFKIRETPAAAGEIFLDKLIAIGTLEQLSVLKGWSIIEPVSRLNAKWIEYKDEEDAVKKGCSIVGPAVILLNHIVDTIKKNSKNILGIQELYYLLEAISETQPVLVEDFMDNKDNLRALKKILINLLEENVRIRDIITILEVCGEHLEDISKTDLITSYIRIELAKQICWSLIDDEGKIVIFQLDEKIERKLLESLKETKKMTTILTIAEPYAHKLILAIRESIKDYPTARALMVSAPLRVHIRRLISRNFPHLAVISPPEIPPEIRIQTAKVISVNEDKKEPEKKGFSFSKKKKEE